MKYISVTFLLLISIGFTKMVDIDGQKFDCYDEAVVNMQTGEAVTYERIADNTFIDSAKNTYVFLDEKYILVNGKYLYIRDSKNKNRMNFVRNY